MKRLLIDTNIFLSFYHYSNDDLEELKKLVVLIDQREIKLYLPEQIKLEFLRNRASKIADALKRLRDQNLNFKFPQISKEYQLFSDLRGLQREYSRKHSELISIIEEDVKEFHLKADETINELFSKAEFLNTTDNIILKARRRNELGNPPGKSGSLGDAIIWEQILELEPVYFPLYFLTEDNHFYSALDSNDFDPFLLHEWQSVFRRQLFHYKNLSSFFKDNYPTIELETEIIKDGLIKELSISGTFRRTHELIYQLNQFTDFTDAQVKEIALIATTNEQVSWIITDHDVKNFVISTIKGRELIISDEILENLNHLLGEEIF